MKFSVDLPRIKEAVEDVKAACSSRGHSGTSRHILLTADMFTVTLVANNGYQEASIEIGAEVEEEGSTVLEANRISDILKKLSGATVSIEQPEKGQARIQGGGAIYRMNSLRKEEFASFPETDILKGSVAGDELAEALTLLTPAMLTDDPTKSYMRSVDFRPYARDDGEAVQTAVASDGRQMLVYLLPSAPMPGVEFTLPGASVRLVAKMFASSELVKIYAYDEGNLIAFADGHNQRKVKTALMELKYPDWPQIFKSISYTDYITVQAETLIKAIGGSSPILGKEEDGAFLQQDALGGEQELFLVSGGSDGEYVAHVPIEESGGNPLQVEVNHQYMGNVCRLCASGGELVTIKYGAANSPLELLSEDGNAIGILMPKQMLPGFTSQMKEAIERAKEELLDGGDDDTAHAGEADTGEADAGMAEPGDGTPAKA